MPELPSHPDTATDPDDEAAEARPRWKTALWIAVVVAALALVVGLHLTGVVGAESHK